MDKKLLYDEIPLQMTKEEYEKTDFYQMTDDLCLKQAQKEVGGAGTCTPCGHLLSRKYKVTIVDEQGTKVDEHHISASIDPYVFVYEHPEYICTGSYLRKK